MKVSCEPIEQCQVALNIEAEAIELDKYMKLAYNHLVGRVAVPGFRKGKTPRSILEQHIGRGAFLQEAMEHMIPDLCSEALKDQKIEAIDQPSIEVIQSEPVKFKVVVPIKPSVKLGAYKDIRIELVKKEITDDDVEKTLEQFRSQKATLIPVDRPVQFGDVITMDIEAKEGDKTVISRKGAQYEVVKDSYLPLPEFSEKIVGLAKGGEIEFTLTYPEDYKIKQVAGKEYQLKVNVGEVKEKKLPELNDEFAKEAGQDTVAALKEQIKKSMQETVDARGRQEFEQKSLDSAVDMSDVQYPPIMKQREIERILREDVKNFPDGVKGFERYLKSINKTSDDYPKEIDEIAHKRLRRAIVLGKIAEEEGVKVEEQEIDAEIERMVSGSERQEDLKKFFNLPQSRDSISETLLTQKALKVLTDITSGNAAESK
ncbi:MAG TPA: trigger factor [Dehalococcoidia bacterium]|nr:trigger factor [Dehalococcoidia bacterium]